MAYDDKPTRHVFPAINFGAGNFTYEVLGPRGKRGLLVDYGVSNVTVAFTATTTEAQVAVGSTTDPDAYGEEIGLGTIGADSGGRSVLSQFRRGSPEYHARVLPGVWIPADAPVRLSGTAPTGGSPAGTATPFVEIIWEK